MDESGWLDAQIICRVRRPCANKVVGIGRVTRNDELGGVTYAVARPGCITNTVQYGVPGTRVQYSTVLGCARRVYCTVLYCTVLSYKLKPTDLSVTRRKI